MNPREALAVMTQTLIGTDIKFEKALPCEIRECGDTTGRRFKTPMGVRCEWCIGRIFAAALENGGRLWGCRCNTNAAPCPEYRGRDLIRSKTKYRYNANGTVKPYGIYGHDPEGPCLHTPCYHLPGCHTPRIRDGIQVAAWYESLKAAA